MEIKKDFLILLGAECFFALILIGIVVFQIPMVKAALTEGVNVGFVTTTPTDNPSATAERMDTFVYADKWVAPAGATAITSIGWWCMDATADAYYQVGIYSHDSVNNQPENLLASSGDISKGTTVGWKSAALSYPITAGTTYWIAAQLDETATGTGTHYATGNSVSVDKYPVTELPASFGTPTDKFSGYSDAIYATYITANGNNIIKLSDKHITLSNGGHIIINK